eukprot:TRINITY_DN23746_c0_g1_i1.p1 TRINITY_DN23746_c0_g1~~TRINITY_DN23746_c0_g1_i1.p1  ORF type:complete len:345 (+),score=77.85 TRINITY_DN23746_c0_g1_i1:37-1035(+)
MADDLYSCRMYEQRFPEIDDLVTVRVMRVAEMGAYVSLLEYNNIEGMILLSELSRRRIRSVNKLIRVGRQEVVLVLRVDKEKGYIDLSKRRVSPEDHLKAEERYNKSKTVHSILRHVAETQHCSLESLYQQFGWPLYRKYGHAYDAFKIAISDPNAISSQFPDIDPELKEAITRNIQRRLTPTAVRVCADLEITCFHFEGINAIKDALRAGEACSTEECPIKVKMIAAPKYGIVTTCMEKMEGLEALGKAIAVIEAKLLEKKGTLTVKVAPRAVTEREDRWLADEAKKEDSDADSESDQDEVQSKTMGQFSLSLGSRCDIHTFDRRGLQLGN